MTNHSNNYDQPMLSQKYIIILNMVFFIFGLLCNAAGFYFSGSKPNSLCHIITGIGLIVNIICATIAFSTKKFSIFDTIALIFTGFILFPCIMLTTSDPNETITYQFILPALYAVLITGSLKVQIVTSITNLFVLCVVDYIRFNSFSTLDIGHTINMVVVFAVVYITSTLILGIFSYILNKALIDEIKLRNVYKKIAKTDPLTSLFNRFGLSETLNETLPAYAIMVDIDHFKKVNDTFGHQIGDHILLAVADSLKMFSAPDKFYVSRYGGEEFLLVSYLSEEETLTICEKIKSFISEKILTPDGKHITVSIGVSLKNLFSEDLIKDADMQLYLSKTNGRNRITVHTI